MTIIERIDAAARVCLALRPVDTAGVVFAVVFLAAISFFVDADAVVTGARTCGAVVLLLTAVDIPRAIRVTRRPRRPRRAPA